MNLKGLSGYIIASLFVFFLSALPLVAQHEGAAEKLKVQSMHELVTGLKKKVDGFNCYIDMHPSLEVPVTTDGHDGHAKYNFRTFKVQLAGDVTDRLSYRFIGSLLGPINTRNSVDGLSNRIQAMYIRYKFNSKFMMGFGKLFGAYGTYSYSLNPIEIHRYSLIENNLDCFKLGVEATYSPNLNNHLTFQVLNASNSTYESRYTLPQRYHKLLVEFETNLMWSANLLNNHFNTFYSLTMQRQANIVTSEGDKRLANLYQVTVGNQMVFSDKFDCWIDALGTLENVDEKGFLTSLSDSNRTYRDVYYMSAQGRFNYSPIKQIRLFVKGIYDLAGSVYKEVNDYNGQYRNMTILGGVEWFALNDSNFRLYLRGEGSYTTYANQSYWTKPIINAGLIYQIPLF